MPSLAGLVRISKVERVKLLNAILAATAAEASLIGAVLSLASLAGGRNGWLDIFAQLSPLWLVLSLVGGVMALVAIDGGVSKVVVVALAAAGLVASGWLIAPELTGALIAKTAHPQEGLKPLRVLTFNTWSNNLDPGGSVDGLLEANADVVALQETAGLGASERRRLLAAYPYWATCRPDACDLILLSRQPWTSAASRQVPVSGGWFTLIWGSTLAPDGRPFTLATVHYAWPFPPGPQAAQRAALTQTVRALDQENLVLAGDFNLTPWSAALRNQDMALSPLQRRTRAVFTWPANIAILKRAAPFPLLPIDHVYAGPAWRTLSVRRLRRLGSDHYPVLVELTRGAGIGR